MNSAPCLDNDVARWHLAATFDPRRAHPFFADPVWGARYNSRVEAPESVVTAGRIVAEGVHVRAQCVRCSARTEHLLDLRGATELFFAAATVPIDFATFGLERVHGLERLLLARPLTAWLRAHRDCAPAPAAPVDPALRRLGEALRREAGDQLRAEGRIGGVTLGIRAGSATARFDHAGADEAAHAGTALRAREVARRARAEFDAVIAAEEVEGGAAGGEWRVVVATREAGWDGRAPIDRFDRPAPGPGVLGAIEWAPLRDECELTDGILVQRTLFPLPRTGKGVEWKVEPARVG